MAFAVYGDTRVSEIADGGINHGASIGSVSAFPVKAWLIPILDEVAIRSNFDEGFGL